MRLSTGVLAAAAMFLSAASAQAGEDAPPARFEQNGKLNIALSMSETEGESRVWAEQKGERNLFLSNQGWVMDGPFQFTGRDLPLNKLNLYQHGEDNISIARQRGLNNDAVVIQNAEPGGSDESAFHGTDTEREGLPDGGFRMDFESGDVEIAAQYNVDGYRASSSFGRSH